MFGGHVSAQDGKSELEQPGLITPISCALHENFKGRERFCGLVSRSVALLQGA